MFNKIQRQLLIALGLSLFTSTVWAHAQLKSAVPGAGATVTASPSEITLNYSEGVEPKFSQVTLAAESGDAIALDKPTSAATDNQILIVEVPTTLKPGTYTVTWHVVSVDTHKTQGHFTFTVAP